MRPQLRSLVLLLSVSTLIGFTWTRSPGTQWGAQRSAGVGKITGQSGAYPVRVASAPISANRYSADVNLLADISGDGLPEVFLAQGRTVGLYGVDGTLIARSGDLADGVTIYGVYDLDGDGVAGELVVSVGGFGGRVYVLDANGLGTLWHAADRGSNYGASRNRVLVQDLDGDGVAELMWRATPVGGFQVVSFANGMDVPEELELGGPFVGSWGAEPPIAGDFLARAGVEFASPNYGPLRIYGVAPQSQPGTSCTLDATLCVNLVGNFDGTFLKHWIDSIAAVDLDADGLDELVGFGEVGAGTVEVTALDPNSGAADGDTAAARMWSYRYGSGSALTTRVAPPSVVRGSSSNLMKSVVAFGVFDDTTAEKDADGVAADDCLDHAGAWGAVVVDGVTGTPLATRLNATPIGSIDPDGDGVSELVFRDVLADGTTTAVRGFGLVCGGTDNSAQWNSCADTGCVLLEHWSITGETVAFTAEPRDPRQILLNRGLVDVTGDATAELLMVENETDLVVYSFDSVSGQPVEHARHTLGACPLVRSVAGPTGARHLLLEGDPRLGELECVEVLNGDLQVVGNFTPDAFATPRADAITGSIGGGKVALGLGDLVYPDANTLAGPQRLVAPDGRGFRPILFADFNGDGVDELITFAEGLAPAIDPSTGKLTSSWAIARYDWNGSRFVSKWLGTAESVGLTDVWIRSGFSLSSSRIATGDFDGDGALEIGAYFVNNQGAVTKGLDRMVFFSATGDSSGNAVIETSLSAPDVGSAGYTHSGVVPVGDVCGASGCPGTDGVDEFIFHTPNRWVFYNQNGLQQSFGVLAGNDWNAFGDDLDGDGIPELLTVSPSLFGVVGITGVKRWAGNYGAAMTPGVFANTTLDVDKDGVRDLIVGQPTGEVRAMSGVDGSELAGFPVFPVRGALSTSAPADARGPEALLAIDIDGDGSEELIVAGGDGYVYALGMGTTPTVEWSVDVGVTAKRLLTSDVDNDGKEELIAVLSDATVVILDGGDGLVIIDQPVAGECFDANTFTASGTAQGADNIEIWVGGTVAATVAVATNGTWTAGPLDWGGPGLKRVEAHGLRAGRLIAASSANVNHWTDDDGDGYSECTPDCDDANAARFPGNSEVCDGLDNDCDAVVPTDELDGDGDGQSACAGDCDDLDATVFDGGSELVDGLDNDCDSLVDEGTTAYDDDGDGFSELGGDCDDANPARSPAAVELANGVDDDCDSTVDEGTNVYDDDGDGVTEDAGDCDDSDPGVEPSALDVQDGVDNNCDDRVDEYSDVSDDDSDGLAEVQGDCDDENASVHPGADESANGVDDDCDGLVDEGTPAWDNDGDGVTAADGDCDDTTATVAPGREDGCTPEGLDAVDNNCDGAADEGCVSEQDTALSNGGGCSSTGGANSGVAGLLALALLGLRRRSGLAVATAALASGTACRGADIEVAQYRGEAVLHRDAEVLDLGKATLGGTSDATLRLWNVGDAAIIATRFQMNEGSFAVDAGLSSVEIGRAGGGADELFVPVHFTPSSAGLVQGVMTIELADATLYAIEVPLVGVGVPSLIQAVPASVDLGFGVAERSAVVTLRNEGEAPVTVASVTGAVSPLVLSPELTGATLAAGSTLDVTLSVSGATEVSTLLALGFAEGGTLSVPVLASACADTAAVSDVDGDGWTSCGGDCDDTLATAHPGAAESANGVDDDCDGAVDEGTRAHDDDGDGYTEDGGDCWDGSATVHPGASEVPGNGIDDNCNGSAHE